MKVLFRLAKKSAKKTFHILQKNGPYFSKALQKEVQVTKLFFNHITNTNKKNRTYSELIERSFIIPFIVDIILYGKISNSSKTY